LKLKLVARHVHDGIATQAEIAYLTAAIYSSLLLEGQPPDEQTYVAAQIGAAVTVGFYDLVVFNKTPNATDF
jgi:hypothetical protein